MSHRASRWLLVILDFKHLLHNRQQVSEVVSSSVNAWRPRSESSYTESYTSFFPSSGDVHIALLDTRSGERLNVWGEPKTSNTEEAEPVVWESVVKMLETFLSEHSLNGADLGPLHHREKPWAVKTRRVSESQAHLPPTSMMDDEEAAIAAAIAASLAEVGQDMSDEESEDDEDEDEDEDTSEDIDMTATPENAEYTGTSVESIAIPTTTPGAWSDVIGGDSPSSYPGVQNRFDALEPGAYAAQRSDAGDGAEDGRGDGDDADDSMEDSGSNSGSNSMDISVPLPDRSGESSSNPKPPAAMASSVESLASNYMERLHSRFRSANDPSLLESRLLRQEQDAELAASLEEDRRKIREKVEKARMEAQAKEAQMLAQNRLPEEPEKSNPAAVAIAIRLPGGNRIMRRFLKTTPFSSIADLCLAHAGLEIVKHEPASCLRSPAVSLANVSWSNDIESVCGGSRAVMFIVHK